MKARLARVRHSKVAADRILLNIKRAYARYAPTCVRSSTFLSMLFAVLSSGVTVSLTGSELTCFLMACYEVASGAKRYFASMSRDRVLR